MFFNFSNFPSSLFEYSRKKIEHLREFLKALVSKCGNMARNIGNNYNLRLCLEVPLPLHTPEITLGDPGQ